MKITIAYLPNWDPLANAIVTAIRCIIPGIKVRKSDRHPPFRHIYMTTRKQENPCDTRENT